MVHSLIQKPPRINLLAWPTGSQSPIWSPEWCWFSIMEIKESFFCWWKRCSNPQFIGCFYLREDISRSPTKLLQNVASWNGPSSFGLKSTTISHWPPTWNIAAGHDRNHSCYETEEVRCFWRKNPVLLPRCSNGAMVWGELEPGSRAAGANHSAIVIFWGVFHKRISQLLSILKLKKTWMNRGMSITKTKSWKNRPTSFCFLSSPFRQKVLFFFPRSLDPQFSPTWVQTFLLDGPVGIPLRCLLGSAAGPGVWVTQKPAAGNMAAAGRHLISMRAFHEDISDLSCLGFSDWAALDLCVMKVPWWFKSSIVSREKEETHVCHQEVTSQSTLSSTLIKNFSQTAAGEKKIVRPIRSPKGLVSLPSWTAAKKKKKTCSNEQTTVRHACFWNTAFGPVMYCNTDRTKRN